MSEGAVDDCRPLEHYRECTWRKTALRLKP
jgi:hypothetical protein